VIQTLLVERLSPFRRRLPTDIYLWAHAILLAIVAIQAVRLLWTIVTPAGPFGAWQPTPARILPAQTQSALFASVDPFFRGTGPAEAGPIATDLQLFGIRGSQGQVPASAILGTSDGEQKSYVVGEEVAPGVKLSAVHFDHVVLSRGGAQQTIYMQGAEQGAPVEAAPGVASESQAPTEPTAAQAFLLRPRNQGGRVTGAVVSTGSNPALFAAAGFKAGDVIVAVNGARITSPVDIQQLEASIAPGARLMLTIERGAQTIPIALNIPGNS
jgi:general secretion pathway protein C